jgi:hypothetical protein
MAKAKGRNDWLWALACLLRGLKGFKAAHGSETEGAAYLYAISRAFVTPKSSWLGNPYF